MKIISYILFLFLSSVLSTAIKAGNLTFVKTISIGITYSIYVDDQYAYITNNNGLSIFSIKDPYNPSFVGGIDVGTSFGIAVDNKVAFVAVNQGIIALDLTDPENVQILSKYTVGSLTHRLLVHDSKLLVTSDLGMDILDISNPKQLKHLSHFTHRKLRAVGASKKTAYLASYNKGIEVVDISNYTDPKHVTFLDSTIGAWDIHTYNDYLYVGRHGAGISIFNIKDSKSPKYLSSYWDDDKGEAQGVWGNEKFLYIADNYGIEVLNIEDPYYPFEIANYMNISAAHDIYVNNGFIYSATGSKSFLILKYD